MQETPDSTRRAVRPAARDRQLARAELYAVIDAHPPSAVPCVGGPLWPNLWTSEHPVLQELAADACTPCPAREECAIFALLHPSEAGVYGGTTEYQRNPGRAQ